MKSGYYKHENQLVRHGAGEDAQAGVDDQYSTNEAEPERAWALLHGIKAWSSSLR